jgi:hypothetical protein
LYCRDLHGRLGEGKGTADRSGGDKVFVDFRDGLNATRSQTAAQWIPAADRFPEIIPADPMIRCRRCPS